MGSCFLHSEYYTHAGARCKKSCRRSFLLRIESLLCSFSWCQSVFRRVGHGRVVRMLFTTVGGGRCLWDSEARVRNCEQFAHSGNLPCYQFTETCSYVSSIQNDIYPWVTSLADWQSQISRFMGPTWSAPGSCRPQMGPMSAPWTLLSGTIRVDVSHDYKGTCRT